MRRISILILLTVMLSLSILGGCAIPANTPNDGGGLPAAGEGDRLAGQIAVRLENPAASSAVAEALGAEVKLQDNGLNLARVILPAGLTIDQAVAKASVLPGVIYAEPVLLYYRPVLPSAGGDAAVASADRAAPSDTYFYKQWGPLATAMDAVSVWDNAGSYSTTTVKVAVIDTGIELDHPDLEANISPLTYYAPTGSTLGSDADDTEGHGTHVAGIIGAVRNNSLGVAGLAWDVSLIAVKVFPDGSAGADTLDIADGIVWAADPTHGDADVINMSLGGKGFSQSMQDAITYAVEQNVVVVVSMGNDYRNQVNSYPAACQGVIAVGAAGAALTRASFSNQGKHISVMAPGVNVYSTFVGNDYTYLDGTSMASPEVAGAAAVLRMIHPTASPAKIRTVLEQTAHWQTNYGSGPPNTAYGYGFVNLYNAVNGFATTPAAYGDQHIAVTSGADFDPVAGAEVVIYQYPSGTPVTSTRTDSSGTAHFPVLPAGTYTASAAKSGSANSSSSFTVVADPAANYVVSIQLT